MVRSCIAFAVLILAGAAASAQPAPAPLTADPLSAPRAAERPRDSLLDATPILAEIPERATAERFRISADLGLPTGVRVGVRAGESRFWAEVGAGVWIIVPFASVALRYDAHLLEGQRDMLAFRPSISATVVPLRDTFFGYGADFEVIWKHRFTEGFITDLGLRFGATAFPSTRHYNAAVAPVLAFVFALQF